MAGAWFVVSLAVFAVGDVLDSPEWPQHRGPGGDGWGAAAELLGGAPFGLERAWARPLGTGYSGIVISNGLGATLYGDGAEDRLIVFDAASGETRWERNLGATYRGHHGSDDGPSSTPAIADGNVYALSPRGRLVACRLEDGELVWERQLHPDSAPDYGFATSPMLVGDLVVLQAAGTTGRSLVAFRRRDGAEIWSAGEQPAAYENATLAQIDGEQQVLATDRRWLFGVEPDSGEILWRHEHDLGHEIGLAQPVVHEQSSVLVSSLDGAALFGVVREEGRWQVTERWRTTDLKRSYTVPVRHQSHAYGFSGSFLVAIDLADGRATWRSRTTGGGNLSLVAGHVAVLGRDGRLVVAPATPDGFRTSAALQVLDGGGVTAPSFAESTFFVRDLTRMAAVRVVPRATSTPDQVAAEPTIVEGRGELERLLARLEGSRDPAAVIGAFLDEQSAFPIVEPDGLVHFVYRGAADFVALKGSVVAFDPSDEAHLPMSRVPGTDLWFVSVDRDPSGHWEYVFEIDGTPLTDPLNPHTVGSMFGEVSELRMPGWRTPAHVEPSIGPSGRLERVRFPSGIRGDEREIVVYLPPGYGSGMSTYPLLLVNNGLLALEQGKLNHTLDNLIGESVEPLVAVFLPRNRDELGGPRTDDYTRTLADELLPFLERRYRLRGTVVDRAIAGVGSGGIAAVHSVVHRPDIFGKLAIQSAYFPSPELAVALLAAAARDLDALTVYVEWSRFDIQVERIGVDAIEDGRRLADALEAAGASVRRNVVDGAPGWASWRAQSDDILELLFPLHR